MVFFIESLQAVACTTIVAHHEEITLQAAVIQLVILRAIRGIGGDAFENGVSTGNIAFAQQQVGFERQEVEHLLREGVVLEIVVGAGDIHLGRIDIPHEHRHLADIGIYHSLHFGILELAHYLVGALEIFESAGILLLLIAAVAAVVEIEILSLGIGAGKKGVGIIEIALGKREIVQVGVGAAKPCENRESGRVDIERIAEEQSATVIFGSESELAIVLALVGKVHACVNHRLRATGTPQRLDGAEIIHRSRIHLAAELNIGDSAMVPKCAFQLEKVVVGIIGEIGEETPHRIMDGKTTGGVSGIGIGNGTEQVDIALCNSIGNRSPGAVKPGGSLQRLGENCHIVIGDHILRHKEVGISIVGVVRATAGNEYRQYKGSSP